LEQRVSFTRFTPLLWSFPPPPTLDPQCHPPAINTFDEIFSGYQPRQVSALNRSFKDHFGYHHQGWWWWWPKWYRHLTWLIALENFVEFSLHESSRTNEYLVFYIEFVCSNCIFGIIRLKVEPILL